MPLTISSTSLATSVYKTGVDKLIELTVRQIQSLFKVQPDPNLTIPNMIHFLFSEEQTLLPRIDSARILLNMRQRIGLTGNYQNFSSTNIFILAYLTILNGHKSIYFNEDGSLDLIKLENHVNSLFVLKIRIDETNNSLIQNIQFSKIDGLISFKPYFTITKHELEYYKPYRGIRSAAEASEELREFYQNSDGICTGLVHFHETILKERFLNPKNSREKKDLFFKKLSLAGKTEENNSETRKQILKNAFQFQEQYEFQYPLYDKELGHVSHIYLTCNKDDFLKKLPMHIAAMKSDKTNLSTLTIMTVSHTVNLTLKINNEILKAIFYEPNTLENKNKKESLCSIGYTHDVNLTNGSGLLMIEKMIDNTHFFQNQYKPETAPAIKVFCHPLDKTRPQDSHFEFITPDISKISDPVILNCLFFFAARDGNKEIIELLLDKSQIDINHTTEQTGHATPLIIASHNNHKEIVSLLLKQKEICINHQMAFHDKATALLAAAKKGNFHVVANLLQKDDIDLTAVSESGLSAIDIAHAEGHTKIAALIQADPRSPQKTLSRHDSDLDAFLDACLDDTSVPYTTVTSADGTPTLKRNHAIYDFNDFDDTD